MHDHPDRHGRLRRRVRPRAAPRPSPRSWPQADQTSGAPAGTTATTPSRCARAPRPSTSSARSASTPAPSGAPVPRQHRRQHPPPQGDRRGRRHERQPTPSTPRSSGTASPPTRSTASAATPSTADRRGRAPRPSLDHTRPTAPSTSRPTRTSRSPSASRSTCTGRLFTLSARIAGCHTPRSSRGGPTTFTLDPTPNFADGDDLHPHRHGGGVTDQDAIDPPDTMAPTSPCRFSVHGRRPPATSAPHPDPGDPGQRRHRRAHGHRDDAAASSSATTRAPSPALRGFFIQDPTGDGDPATSDGIFVFEGSNANTVKLGDLVRVTGNAGENQGQTQVSVGTIVELRHGHGGADRRDPSRSPAPRSSSATRACSSAAADPVGHRALPARPLRPGRPLAGRPAPAADQRRGARAPPPLALQAANNLNKIILDDASQAQNPDPILFGRDGQPAHGVATRSAAATPSTGIVGVLTYTWAGNAASANAYRVRPVDASAARSTSQPANPRPVEPAGRRRRHPRRRDEPAQLLQHASTPTGNNCRGGLGGSAMDCRGADTRPRVRPPVAQDGRSGLGHAGRRRRLHGDRERRLRAGQRRCSSSSTGSTRSDGARYVGVHRRRRPHRTARCARHRRDQGRHALQAGRRHAGGHDRSPQHPRLRQRRRLRARATVPRSRRRSRTTRPAARSSPSPTTSRARAAPATPPTPATARATATRSASRSAQLLADWLAGDPTGTGDPDVLILGDLNSYAKEDPITTLEKAGFTNLIEQRIGREAYSYAFDGQWGYLDHALGSASIDSQVTGVGDWHVNADEPSILDYNTDFKTRAQVTSLYAPDQFRISDHDPVVVGLDLTNAAPVVGPVTGPSSAVSVGAPAGVSATFTRRGPARHPRGHHRLG